MNSHEVFIHIHQGCFAGTGAIVRLPQCQWSKPDGYGKISQCITTTKHSKAKTVCIFLGIYCTCALENEDISCTKMARCRLAPNHYPNHCCDIVNRAFGNIFQRNWIQTGTYLIHKMFLKMSSAKWWSSMCQHERNKRMYNKTMCMLHGICSTYSWYFVEDEMSQDIGSYAERLSQMLITKITSGIILNCGVV